VVNTLLEICPDAHDGNDCRYYLRMRDKMNSVPFACYTSLGLYSVLSGVFRTLEGDPPPTEAFAVFFSNGASYSAQLLARVRGAQQSRAVRPVPTALP